jgi:hypothetical protein
MRLPAHRARRWPGAGSGPSNNKTLIDRAGLRGIDVILAALTPERARLAAAVEQAKTLINKTNLRNMEQEPDDI